MLGSFRCFITANYLLLWCELVMPKIFIYSHIVQSVEHLTVNQVVVGSSPTVRAKCPSGSADCFINVMRHNYDMRKHRWKLNICEYMRKAQLCICIITVTRLTLFNCGVCLSSVRCIKICGFTQEAEGSGLENR